MSQIIPIYIPTFISDATFAPSRVLPHIYFFNGMINCEEYYIESGSLTTSGMVKAQTSFPYFDNYNVVTGSYPTDGSKSLLFNNEAASYGVAPSSSLYSEYWDTYVSLLYNPKTRLLNCSAIIPLADYFKMELNDIVNFRGNYYHLRAINDYSLKTGECNLQLLGPIISDTFTAAEANTPTTTTTTTSTTTTTTTTSTTTTTTTTTTTAQPTANLSFSYTKSSPGGYMDIIVNDVIIQTLNSTGTGNYNVVQGDIIRTVIQTSGCQDPDIKANAYTFGIIADAACTDNATSLSTSGYTVVSGDIGNTLTLDGYSSCTNACI